MPVIITTDADFEKELEANSTVIVKYFADWCGSCKLFSPKYRRLSEDERFCDVHFLDVDAENNPTARATANVDNLPYFAIFKNGELIEGIATAKEETVVAMLEKVLA